MITTLITITKIIITNIILETTVEVRQDDTRLKNEKESLIGVTSKKAKKMK